MSTTIQEDKTDGEICLPMPKMDGEGWNLFKAFLTNSTTHGLPNMINEKPVWKKIAWGLVFFVALVVLFALTVVLVKQYHSYNTNVELVNGESIEFPAVTVCNFNRMRRSRLSKNERLKPIVEVDGSWNDYEYSYNWWWESYFESYQYNSSYQSSTTPQPKKRKKRQNPTTETSSYSWLYDDYWSSFDFGENTWSNFEDWYRNIPDDGTEGLIEIINPSLTELRELGHQPEDFILHCRFNRRKCNYSDFTMFQTKQYGNCFTLNTMDKELHGFMVTKAGSKNGLHLTLFIERPEYVGFLSEEIGVRLAIHPSNVLPHPEDIGLSLAPGFATSIGIRQVELVRLPPPYGNCTNGKVQTQHQNYNYSIISCQKKCRLQEMKDKCGCVDDFDEDFKSVSQCGAINSKCCQTINKDFYSNSIICDCPASCHEIVYTPQLSTSEWPTEGYRYHEYERLRNEGHKQYRMWERLTLTRSNYVRVKVYFQDLNYELVAQVPAKNTVEILADIGGIFGLFLGMSFLTIWEVLILVVDFLILYPIKKARSITIKHTTTSRQNLHIDDRKK